MYNDEYLMHFNPFHNPKNGQFTSGGGARRYQKQLNKFSDKAYKAEAEYRKAAYNEGKYFHKMQKDGKYEKYEPKASKQYYKRVQKEAESRYYEEMAIRMLKEAKEKGYTIDSKEIVRDAAAGRKMAGYFFGGHIGYRIAENMYGGNGASMISTTKYKVRK